MLRSLWLDDPGGAWPPCGGLLSSTLVPTRGMSVPLPPGREHHILSLDEPRGSKPPPLGPAQTDANPWVTA